MDNIRMLRRGSWVSKVYLFLHSLELGSLGNFLFENSQNESVIYLIILKKQYVTDE